MNPELARIIELPISEQLEIVEQLWDHIATSEEPLPVSQWQKDELDRREANFQANPDLAVSWEEAKRKIRRQ